MASNVDHPKRICPKCRQSIDLAEPTCPGCKTTISREEVDCLKRMVQKEFKESTDALAAARREREDAQRQLSQAKAERDKALRHSPFNAENAAAVISANQIDRVYNKHKEFLDKLDELDCKLRDLPSQIKKCDHAVLAARTRFESANKAMEAEERLEANLQQKEGQSLADLQKRIEARSKTFEKERQHREESREKAFKEQVAEIRAQGTKGAGASFLDFLQKHGLGFALMAGIPLSLIITAARGSAFGFNMDIWASIIIAAIVPCCIGFSSFVILAILVSIFLEFMGIQTASVFTFMIILIVEVATILIIVEPHNR